MHSIAILLLLFVAVASTKRVLLARTYRDEAEHAKKGWQLVKTGETLESSRASGDELLKFRVLLKHDAHVQAALDKTLDAVSSPTSASYGKWLSRDGIRRVVGNGAREERVLAWLKTETSPGSVHSVVRHGDALTVTATAAAAEALFACRLHRFAHRSAPRDVRVRALGEVSVPKHVARDVELVVGLTEFLRPTKVNARAPLSVFVPKTEATRAARRAAAKRASAAAATASVRVAASADDLRGGRCPNCPNMTPDFLRTFYNVSEYLAGPGWNHSLAQAVGAFQETYSPAAARKFGNSVAKSKYPFVIAQNVGPWQAGTDEGEGDLDVQYVLGMGNNVESLFWACDDWILEFTLDVEQSEDTPLVFSLSYGTSIEEQCAIASVWCNLLGYNSSAYVARTNLEFQKLGARGITVLVSSGDNGAVGRGNNGHCPLDTYCPLGGCQYQSSRCMAVVLTIVKEEFEIDCVLPLGMRSFGCAAIMNSLGVSSLNDMFKFVQDKLQTSGARAGWDVDVEGNPHLYSEDACSNIHYEERLDFSNVTLQGFVFDPSEEHVASTFISEYPGVSPFILSVGATNIVSEQRDDGAPEIVASIETGGIISGGGGVAVHELLPSYQAKYVQAYLSGLPSSQLPPQVMWSQNRRVTPDVSLAGERYVIVTKLPNGTLAYELVSGTSASSPALAGLLSLINSEMKRAGHQPGLGFINPAIYAAYESNPQIFNDITEGNNRCTHVYCCKYGWYATQGFDAATGLGSINHGLLLDYFMDLKNSKAKKQ